MLKRGFNGFHHTFTCLSPLKSLILYSTSVTSKDGITSPPMVEYLVKSVGFSQDEAVSIAAKVSSHRSKSSEKPQLVVDFLKSSGFDESHIRRVLTYVPKLLYCKIDKTLDPKIRVFQEMGLSGSKLGLLISLYPQLLNRSLKAHIVPSLEILKSLIGSNEELISLLLKTKSQRMLSGEVLKNLPHNLQLLQSYGVSKGKIKQLILRRPLLLMQRTHWLEEKANYVEEKFGIPPYSAMFIHGIVALSMVSEEKLDSNFQLLHSHGWSETEILRLSRRLPYTLGMSEKMLRTKLKYFMEDLGFGPDYLATHPVLLNLSMEKRIVPRTAIIQALMEKQLLKYNEKYYTLMCKSESKFVARYMLPIKDKLPQVYENYMQQTSSEKEQYLGIAIANFCQVINSQSIIRFLQSYELS